nr:hypothetical protein [Arabiibacter massiliensis]
MPYGSNCTTFRMFWSSDKLTGSQTDALVIDPAPRFWSSDKLTGSQTENHPDAV